MSVEACFGGPVLVLSHAPRPPAQGWSCGVDSSSLKVRAMVPPVPIDGLAGPGPRSGRYAKPLYSSSRWLVLENIAPVASKSGIDVCRPD